MGAEIPRNSKKFWINGGPFTGMYKPVADLGGQKFWVQGGPTPYLFPADTAGTIVVYGTSAGRSYAEANARVLAVVYGSSAGSSQAQLSQRVGAINRPTDLDKVWIGGNVFGFLVQPAINFGSQKFWHDGGAIGGLFVYNPALPLGGKIRTANYRTKRSKRGLAAIKIISPKMPTKVIEP